MARVKITLGIETTSGGEALLRPLPLDLIAQERAARSNPQIGEGIEGSVWLAHHVATRTGLTTIPFEEWMASELLDLWTVDEGSEGKGDTSSS